MQARMDAMQRQTAALTARLHEVEQHKAILVGQLSSMRDQWSVAVNENMRLADEAGRSPHEVCCFAILCCWASVDSDVAVVLLWLYLVLSAVGTSQQL